MKILILSWNTAVFLLKYSSIESSPLTAIKKQQMIHWSNEFTKSTKLNGQINGKNKTKIVFRKPFHFGMSQYGRQSQLPFQDGFKMAYIFKFASLWTYCKGELTSWVNYGPKCRNCILLWERVSSFFFFFGWKWSLKVLSEITPPIRSKTKNGHVIFLLSQTQDFWGTFSFCTFTSCSL